MAEALLTGLAMSEDRTHFVMNGTNIVCKTSLRDDLEKMYNHHEWVYEWLKDQPGVRRLRGRYPVFGAKLFGEDCIVKRHFHGGVFAHFATDRFIGSDRLLNAMKSADYLLEKKIITPEYRFIAWRSSRVWTRYESCVVWFTTGMDAAKFFFSSKQQKNAAYIVSRAKQIGAFIHRLHDVNFYHQDLNLMNLLLIDNKQIAVLDLDKCLPPDSSLPDHMKNKNLYRLYRSVRKLGRQHSVKYVESIIQALRKGYEEA